MQVRGQFSAIAPDVAVGDGTRVGNFVMIRGNTIIGEEITIGSYVDIEGDVVIGNHVSLQSGCYITRGVVIEDEVFCGPRVITMNDKRISPSSTGLTFVRRGRASSGPRV